MSTEVLVPTLGESVSEATIASWSKNVGDSVKQDETLCELETDKVSIEVPAPTAGVIIEIVQAEGSDVAVGGLLCIIDESASATTSTATATAAPAEKPTQPQAQQAAPAPSSAPQAASNNHQSPAVKRHLEETGVNAGQVNASGPKGNITKGDVLQAASAPKPTPQPQSPQPLAPQYVPASGVRPFDERGEERVKMSKLRKTIATRLKEAQNTAAMLTTFNEIDMTNLMALRQTYKDMFEKKHETKLGFMSFFVKAVISALQELPAVNAEIYGDEIIYKNYYDIGIAVGTPQGLVVPVVRDADKHSFAQIESSIADFGRRARAGKLALSEMAGGTFTITNGGVYGSLLSTPIINPPQSAILGMHKIQKRPIVDKDNNIVIGQMMYIALSYDHRIIDGREAVTFLVRVKECLEDPARLLFDV